MGSLFEGTSVKLLWQYAIAVAVLWSVLVVGSLAWNASLSKKQNQALLHKEALTNFNKDQAFRLWGTKHGGVYVPVTNETQPNPYLAHVTDRDIVAPSGQKLTLVNPAWMTRQIMADYEELYGIKGKITGERILNPVNTPDDWEKSALAKLKAGSKEVIESATIDGIPHLRVMSPVFMEKGCEKCHGYLGFKAGDLRGGVSIAVPSTPYIEATSRTFKVLASTHLVAWLLGLLGIFLTARKGEEEILAGAKTSRALRKTDHTLSEILRISPSAILTTTETGIVTQFNRGAVDIFGYEPEEIIGKPFDILMPKEFRRRHKKYIKDFANQEDSRLAMDDRDHVSGIRKDGTTFPAAASVSKVEVDGDRLFTVALHDLTHRIEREALLREARDEAEVANRSKSEFLANISHEIRTPLTAMKGMLELIDTDKLSEEDRNYIKIASGASDSVITIINDILDLARLEAGRTVLDISSFDLKEFIDETSQLLLSSVESKGLKFNIDFPGDEPITIKGDVQRLRQILINLIGNATKFTEEGSITLKVNVVQRDDRAKAQIAFSITDTGIGIREKDLARLFERFEQEDTTTTRKHGGTGLGLAICQELASLMAGTVSATSVYGEGSTFRLQITTEVVDAREPANASLDTTPHRQQSLHLLVAEDNQVNQMIVKEFLNKLGHTCQIVPNGQEAINTLGSSPTDHFDIVLMDVQMPIIDGLEATYQIRSSGKAYANVPIIALTADAMTQHKDVYDEIGMDGFIAKPYTPDDLAAEISQVLNQKSTEQTVNFAD